MDVLLNSNQIEFTDKCNNKLSIDLAIITTFGSHKCGKKFLTTPRQLNASTIASIPTFTDDNQDTLVSDISTANTNE